MRIEVIGGKSNEFEKQRQTARGVEAQGEPRQ